MKPVQGTPNLLNQQIDYVTDAGDNGREIDATARIVYVTFAGFTLKLPAQPKEGATLKVAAIGGNVSLDGNGNAYQPTPARLSPRGPPSTSASSAGSGLLLGADRRSTSSPTVASSPTRTRPSPVCPSSMACRRTTVTASFPSGRRTPSRMDLHFCSRGRLGARR